MENSTDVLREFVTAHPDYSIWHTERTWWATRRALIVEDGKDATVFADTLTQLGAKLDAQHKAADPVPNLDLLDGEL